MTVSDIRVEGLIVEYETKPLPQVPVASPGAKS